MWKMRYRNRSTNRANTKHPERERSIDNTYSRRALGISRTHPVVLSYVTY